MRGIPLAVFLALAGCNPGIAPPQQAQNGAAPVRDERNPAPRAPVNEAGSASAHEGDEAAAPEAAPDVPAMSPYRRREYERGYRDCMSGNFDGERQGESYRIGCMAAEDVKQRRSGR